MPRTATYPDTVESCWVISLTQLKKEGFFKGHMKGPIYWKRGGETMGSVNIEVRVKEPTRFMRVSYTATLPGGAKKERNLIFSIDAVPSNLGKGHRYYFVCPYTEKRCMKLYMPPIASYFAHREHWQNLYYDQQTKNKSFRALGMFLDLDIRIKEKEKSIGSPYMKRYYKGKPTPKYISYLRLREKRELYGMRAMRVIKQ